MSGQIQPVRRGFRSALLPIWLSGDTFTINLLSVTQNFTAPPAGELYSAKKMSACGHAPRRSRVQTSKHDSHARLPIRLCFRLGYPAAVPSRSFVTRIFMQGFLYLIGLVLLVVAVLSVFGLR